MSNTNTFKVAAIGFLFLLCTSLLLLSLSQVQTKEQIKSGSSWPNLHFTKVSALSRNLKNLSTARVVNGDSFSDSLEKFPFYMVSLLNRGNRNNIWHTCGGTLITPNIILTAAHCRYSVRVAYIGSGGETYHARYLSKDSQDMKRLIFFKDEDKYVHPKYSRRSLSHDIMLIKLPIEISDAPWKNEIFPQLHKPSQEVPTQRNSLTLMGWGHTTHNGEASSNLLTATLDYVSDQDCMEAYGNSLIDDSMLCARSSKGRDACQGDSGGPLLSFQNDELLLLGSVSWGHVCAHPKYPGVYSRIATSHDWINHTICNKLSPESCTEDQLRIKKNFATAAPTSAAPTSAAPTSAAPTSASPTSASPTSSPKILSKATSNPTPLSKDNRPQIQNNGIGLDSFFQSESTVPELETFSLSNINHNSVKVEEKVVKTVTTQTSSPVKPKKHHEAFNIDEITFENPGSKLP